MVEKIEDHYFEVEDMGISIVEDTKTHKYRFKDLDSEERFVVTKKKGEKIIEFLNWLASI